MTSFKLEKGYFDLVDSQGRVFVGYLANLHWKNLKLGYKGFILYQKTDGIIEERDFSYSTQNLELDNDQVFLSINKLNGCWTRKSEAINETLLDSNKGKIVWKCYQPKSEVMLTYKTHQLLGNGYVEKISISIPPWNIPIQELYWGRYHSSKNTAVWIRWVGTLPRTWIYWNGTCTLGEVNEQRITFGPFTIELVNSVALKNESIGNSLFEGLRNLKKLFPSKIFRLRELKWAGIGILSEGDRNVEHGTVLHEKVIWP